MAPDFKIQKLVGQYKTMFLGKRGKRWNSSKTFCLYLSFLKNGFEACQKSKSNIIRLEIMAECFKMQKLLDKYKTIFLGKRGKRWNSSKTFSLYMNFLQNGLEPCQKPKWNLIRLEIMAQGFKMQKLVDEYKTIFLGKRRKRWNSSETSFLHLSFLENGFEACQKRK